MQLLHWSKGFFDCKIAQVGSGDETKVEVDYSKKTSPNLSNKITSFPITHYSSFTEYWDSFISKPKWYTAWPIYIHPSLKDKIEGSIYKIPLRELTPSEISYLDKWKTYLNFRIPAMNSTSSINH